MTSTSELVDHQKELGDEISRIIKNYKKDSTERKSTSAYFNERLRRLDQCWNDFEATDEKLRIVTEQPMQQEYFTSGYYDKISSLVVTYRDLFLTEANRFKAEEEMKDMPSITPRQLAPGTSTGKTATSQQVAEKEASETSIQHGLVRKMTARMATLRRALEKAVQDNQPLQFYRMKTNNISHLWTQIELVYDELWEKLENPAVAGFDQAEYDQLDEMVQFQLVELSIKADQYQHNRAAAPTIREEQTIRNTVHLPKVTLPQFNGDYLKWQQFFDLFSEMIDKQPLAAVQKMWYLKANVTGEAAKLISHFAPTEDNYLAAWTLLQERYNNRRVIVATLIEKLVNQPSGTSTAATTKNLHDTTRECIMALGNIGIDTKAWDPILFHLLLKKLDRATHIRFEQSLTNPKELQKVDDFLMFLEGQFHTLEAIGLKDKVATPQQHNRVVTSIATSTKTNSCKLCDNGNHPLYFCKKFLQQSPTESQLWVKKQRYCFNCLKNDHTSNNCKSRCCSKCDKKHNTLLNLENVVQKQQVLKVPSADEAINNIPNVTVSSAATSNVSTQGYVLLATARIRITAANGNSGDFRAILDSGSQINIVSERLIMILSISPTKASLCIEGIGDAQKKVTQRINVKMQSTNGSLTTNLEAFVLPHIITAQPNFQVDTSSWKIPTNLLLADPDFYKQGKVDILLGAEFYLSLLEPGHIKLMTNGPTLQNTSLGWIVSGKCESSEPSAESLTCAVFGLQTDNNSRDSPLIEAIERLWKMDEVESTEQSVSPADQQCETHFVQNMRKNVQGRFIVKLPFLENPSALGESRTMAHNRFLGLERRLQRNAVIQRQYVEFMREYESLGHMQKVNLDSIPSPKYFIPHHCVLKPESTTTKLRVVFDASAKTTTGYALNDLMHTGPTVQSELFSILLRFRLSRFVFTTDIEEMYRQILIHPEDRRYQVIIWREDPTAKINYYQLNTVTYGTRAAPYLATKCLQQIANNNMQNHPLGAQLLHDNFYVDDGLGGSDSLDTAISLLTGQVNGEWIYEINHHNSFDTLQRIIGYVLRFIKHTRSKQEFRSQHTVLSVIEQEQALAVIIKTIQAYDFKEEIRNLKHHYELKNGSSLRSLSPFLDDTNILRVGGRLEAATLPFDAKHQMVLPYDDPLVKLLFIKVHEENNHCGPQALLGTLRQRFWPLKGKTTARSVVQHCIRCRKAHPQLVQQMMGNLPATRVTPARPFINTGVDYAGPLWVHYKVRGKKPTKAYLAVFCCFASKAVHLELVTELSTDAFIGALKRFISRRGRCQNLYSDNATNFIGARNQLIELSSAIYSSSAQEQIKKTCNNKGIQFHFIPPKSPHFGGLWEAAVKLAKNLLLRSVASASLTYEELETVIVEIEAILNSRPFTPLSSDPSDLTALTPGHLLIGEALTAQVDIRADSTKLSLLSRWKLVSQVKHEFWRRWSNEYLNELQQRHKWTRETDNIKIGELVVIKEDNIPVMRWPLGRILEVYKGPDGAVRVVDVRTATGTYKRAIHRLARLPIHTDIGTESKEEVTTRKRKDEKEEEPPRRSKTARNYSLVTFLAILLMLPIVWCEPVKITKFNPNAGIHFEHIGSSKIISSEWNLIVYYDLTPLHTEIQLLKDGTTTMNHMCEQIQPTTKCDELVTQFQHTNAELYLDKGLLASHRQKRGALNVVGNVANSLFGVLDSEYARQMSETITAINDNEQHLTSMMKKQISVIDSTINIIKRDQTSAQMSFEKLEGRLAKINDQIRHNEEEAQKEQTFQMFLSLAFQLPIMTSNVYRVQTALINVFTNVHHGQISPQLLSPQQLNDEILKITAHLSPSMQIPGYNGNLLSIYKLMNVKAAITEKHAIFQITIPLTNLNQFNLYRLIPIPTKINNTMMEIKLSTTVLAVNAHRDQYFPITAERLRSCFRMENELYLCANNQPTYNKGSEVCACEVSLLNNETRSHCKFEQRENHVWTQVNDRNQWMFALSTPIQITVVCDNKVSQISLEGSGFMELTSGCVLKYQLLTITSNPILSSSTSSSYTAFGHIINVNETKPASLPVLDTTEIEYSPALKELSRLQEILEAHEINDLPNKLQTHQYHSFAVSYSALFLTVVLILAILIMYKRQRRRASSKASQATHTNSPITELPRSEIIANTPPQVAPRYSRNFCVDI